MSHYQDKVVARRNLIASSNWFFQYKGFTLSAFLDDAKQSEVRGVEMELYTRMDVVVFGSNNDNCTEAFFGKSSDDGEWHVSTFTEFLEYANKFKEVVDQNEKLRRMWNEPHAGVLGLSRPNALKHLRDTGLIAAHTVCPFRGACEIAHEGLCLHGGVNHTVPFSCAAARSFPEARKVVCDCVQRPCDHQS